MGALSAKRVRKVKPQTRLWKGSREGGRGAAGPASARAGAGERAAHFWT